MTVFKYWKSFHPNHFHITEIFEFVSNFRSKNPNETLSVKVFSDISGTPPPHFLFGNIFKGGKDKIDVLSVDTNKLAETISFYDHSIQTRIPTEELSYYIFFFIFYFLFYHFFFFKIIKNNQKNKSKKLKKLKPSGWKTKKEQITIFWHQTSKSTRYLHHK